MDANGPNRLVLDRVADKWSVLVLGLVRRNDPLQRAAGAIDGISQKMLAQALRQLERDGWSAARDADGAGCRSNIRSRRSGEPLSKTVGALSAWAEKHFPDVLRAQQSMTGRRRD